MAGIQLFNAVEKIKERNTLNFVTQTVLTLFGLDGWAGVYGKWGLLMTCARYIIDIAGYPRN